MVQVIKSLQAIIGQINDDDDDDDDEQSLDAHPKLGRFSILVSI